MKIGAAEQLLIIGLLLVLEGAVVGGLESIHAPPEMVGLCSTLVGLFIAYVSMKTVQWRQANGS